MPKLLCQETLPLKLTNRNEGQGRKWYSSARDRKRIAQKLAPYKRKPFQKRVDVVLVRVLGKREARWDSDSVLRGNAKQLIDTLVEFGWFHDDGPRYIRYVLGDQDDSRRSEGPAVEIRVYEEGAIGVME